MKLQPLVSVIIPTYNRPDKLKDAIESVLQQSYKNFEIIVVNDGGDTIKDFLKNPNILYYNGRDNKGLASTRNFGIKRADGEYIVFLDDDDILYPDHLETLITYLENSNIKIAYTDAYRVIQEPRDGQYVTISKDIPYSNDYSRESLLDSNLAPVQCFMFEKSCLKDVGLFDENLAAHEDWDFWIRFSQYYDFHHIPIVTSEFRQRTDNTNMSTSRSEDFQNSHDIVAARYSKIKEGAV